MKKFQNFGSMVERLETLCAAKYEINKYSVTQKSQKVELIRNVNCFSFYFKKNNLVLS